MKQARTVSLRRWIYIKQTFDQIARDLNDLSTVDGPKTGSKLLNEIESLADSLRDSLMSLDEDEVEAMNNFAGPDTPCESIENAEELVYAISEFIQSIKPTVSGPHGENGGFELTKIRSNPIYHELLSSF